MSKVLRDQKEEYTEHLLELINQPLITVFRKIYNEVLKSKECNAKNVLKLFQKQLAAIPEWNQIKIKDVYDQIIKDNKCRYFPDLIKTVYMLTLKIVLLGIPNEKRKKLQIRIPVPESFVHRCLIHVARELWKRPYLLYHETRSVDCQRHIHECELIIRKKLKSVIRETIPLEWIMAEFDNINSTDNKMPEPLSESEAEEEESEAEEEESEAEEEESEAEEEESEAEEEEEEAKEAKEEEQESEAEEEEEAGEEESEEEEEAEEEEQESEAEEESEEEEESEAEEEAEEEESEAEKINDIINIQNDNREDPPAEEQPPAEEDPPATDKILFIDDPVKKKKKDAFF